MLGKSTGTAFLRFAVDLFQAKILHWLFIFYIIRNYPLLNLPSQKEKQPAGNTTNNCNNQVKKKSKNWNNKKKALLCCFFSRAASVKCPAQTQQPAFLSPQFSRVRFIASQKKRLFIGFAYDQFFMFSNGSKTLCEKIKDGSFFNIMKNVSTVFYASSAILLLLVAAGVAMPSTLESLTGSLQSFLTDSFGWYYLIVVTLFVVVCLYLLVSPVGRIKLGKQEDEPEFSRPTWLAMLFSAGVGIGLVFYGTAEPISHYAVSSPTGETGTDQAVKDAMRFTFFHWGIHAWAIYGIVALCLAYFMFRRGEAGLISSTLKPVLGHHATGAAGKIVDVIAVIATVIGVATTLGFGAVQINGGLSFLFGVPATMTSQFFIILVVTVLFMISALTGLGKGIKILSNVNMILASALFLLMFLLGPTLFTLNLFTDTIGKYVQNFVNMSLRIAPLNSENRDWINGWTIFYWAWWIAWSPFVGIFIARVSKGRTIREFITFVLLAPSFISFLWFSVFGGSAIMLERSKTAVISSLAAEESLFGVLANYPMGMAVSILAICLIGTFFVTSADSGTYVLGMMTTNGSQNPGTRLKMIWGVLLAVIALVLLYSGGLQALQNTMIIAAFPFSMIMVLMAASLLKALNQEAKTIAPASKKRNLKKN